MEKIRLHDKDFSLAIEASIIEESIKHVADQINKDLLDEAPLFLGVLNGAFMFVADLLKHITIPNTEVSFVKIASYVGTNSTGHVKELIGLDKNIAGRTVVIVEDMVDSGLSMAYLKKYLEEKSPKQIKLATMFSKPNALQCELEIDYCCMTLENDFVVGRGLDYDGLGRNLPNLYTLCLEK